MSDIKKSPLDAVRDTSSLTGATSVPSASDVYGYLYGDFYGLECVTNLIKESILDITWLANFDITLITDKLSNVVLNAADSSVTSYLSSNYGIDTSKMEYPYLRTKSLLDYVELSPMTRPTSAKGDSQQVGKNNALVMLEANSQAVWVGHAELKDIIAGAVLLATVLEKKGGNDPKVIQKLNSATYHEQLLQQAYKECFAGNIQVQHMFLPNQAINSEATTEGPLVHYNLDNMARRRPTGEYFTVEMIAPSGGEGTDPIRIDLKTASSTVSSLMLNMSPASLIINAAKKTNRYQTLIRWVEEHWGDELDQITFSGTTFSFLDFKTTESGLCVSSRNMTEPYKELRHLVDIYDKNGIVYQSEKLVNTQPRTFFNTKDPGNPFVVRTHPRAGMPQYRLYIKLSCYFAEFIGYFESFDVTEDANKPFSLSYNVSFRAEHTKWK